MMSRGIVTILRGAASLATGAIGCSLAIAVPIAAQTVAQVGEGGQLQPIPAVTTGRVVAAGDHGAVLRQWPGTYWETRFDGPAVLFRLGPGQVTVSVSVDGQAPLRLPDAPPGLWQVAGLTHGPHHLRVQVVGELQDEPTGFGGFLAPPGTRSLPLGRRARQIELIGDSHTAGYANLSTRQDCTEAEIAATTDSFAGIAGRVAAAYDADVAVQAISGRGVVRNVGGLAAPTLPQVWPFALFDRQVLAARDGWNPQLIVISLGTNDFSTPVQAGERWADRAALHADYQATYAAFLRTLRQRHPTAYLLVWATDIFDGEVATQARAVVDRMRADGERRIGFVPVDDLRFAACEYHPDLADDQAIATAIAAHVDRQQDIWPDAVTGDQP